MSSSAHGSGNGSTNTGVRRRLRSRSISPSCCRPTPPKRAEGRRSRPGNCPRRRIFRLPGRPARQPDRGARAGGGPPPLPPRPPARRDGLRRGLRRDGLPVLRPRGRAVAHPHGGRHRRRGHEPARAAARGRARRPGDARRQGLDRPARRAAAARRSSTGSRITGSCSMRSSRTTSTSPTRRARGCGGSTRAELPRSGPATRRCLADRAPRRGAAGQGERGWLWAFVRAAPARARRRRWYSRFGAPALEMLFPVLTQQIVDRALAPARLRAAVCADRRHAGLLVVSLAVTIVQRRMLSRVAVEIDVQSLDLLTGRLLGCRCRYFETRRTGDIDRRLDGVRQIRATGGPGRRRRP